MTEPGLVAVRFPSQPEQRQNRRMHLQPYACVDGLLFTAGREDVIRAHGPPLSEKRNSVGLTALDYGNVVYRFQDGGRLEEVTVRTSVLHLGAVAVPLRDLATFLRAHDEAVFERAGFVVSPRYGVAFVPDDPYWLTALARHCLVQWKALSSFTADP